MTEHRVIIRCKTCKSICHLPHRLGLITAHKLNDVGWPLCKECGSTAGWTSKVESWVSYVVWHKPTTWFKGEWK